MNKAQSKLAVKTKPSEGSLGLGQFRLDLGIGRLLPEWKEIFGKQGFFNDLAAGAMVACVSVPLCLAIALASGVEPGVGLITGVVASFSYALLGGTPLGISGPAAVMAVLVASIIQQYGFAGMLFVGAVCGGLQVLVGVLGLGRFVRFVPLPVIAGLTAGIGAIILIGQLPRALGLPPPDQSHVFDVITHIRDLVHETRASSLALAGSTIFLTLAVPKYFPRLPAALIAVVIPSVVISFLGIKVQAIGAISNSFPVPRIPTFSGEWIKELLGTGGIVFALASLETLLSSSAVNKISGAPHHDPDQELIGQGFANIFSSLFGGIPVTSVIARSALNIQSGAKTRRAGVFHAIILAASVYFFAPLLGLIPTAVLAGLLLSIALRMLHPQEFLQLWRFSRSEALIYLVTFFIIVFLDLMMGIQAGVGAALIITAVRLGKSQTNVNTFQSRGPSHVSIQGHLTFLSAEKVRSSVEDVDFTRGIVFDLSAVKSIDVSGGNQLIEFLEELIKKNIKFALAGLDPECRRVLVSLDSTGKVTGRVAANETEILTILDRDRGNQPFDRLVYGVEKFKRELWGYQSLFEKLATGQSPHTLFITCSDSRINPNLITSTDPGELFIVRNVGNIIPPFGLDSQPAEGAAVEYAIAVLGVKEIVICGHSGCGAMSALLSEEIFSSPRREELPSVVKWLEGARGIKKQLPPGATPAQAAELNSLLQLENLKTYPIIQKKLEKKEIRLHAWYYDIGKAELEEWDENRKIFVTIGSKTLKSLERSMEAGVQFQSASVIVDRSGE